MLPILFAPSATTFTTNGIGRLSDAITCTVHEERNGVFELEMTYPVTGKHFADIVHSAIIVAKPSARRSIQAFRIYKITKPLNGRITVLAQHISYQLSFIPVSPFSADNLTNALAGFKSNAAETCPFTLTADFTNASSYAVSLPVSIRSYMGGTRGSILDVYGGEWEFDNYSCVLHSARGQDNGYTIRYGKNLVDLKQEQSIENTYTGIYPYWTSDEVTVTLTEKVIHAATAANFPFQRTVVKDFSDKFQNAPTEAQLRNYTNSFITANNIGVPNVNLTVDFVHLGGYANIDLCDKVKVYFEKLGIEVTSKIFEITWNVLKDRYDSIQIGNKRSTLADTIEDQIDAVSYMATTEQVGRSIDRATGVLNSGKRGHVIINRNPEGWANEILFLDNENIAQAVNVLRINMNGIGFSSNGYNGNYFQSWDLLGHLTLGGVNNSYGDLTILDENAIPRVQLDKTGLRLWNIYAIGYYSNGTFYSDSDHTTAITPTAEKCYYDLSTGTVYIYTNGAYSQVSGKQGLLAKMTNEGLAVYAGTIDFDWGADTGFHADGEKVQIGDFVCDSTYGRSIFQSTDEMTGMSAETDDPDQLYLWAGYSSDNDYVFVVNGSDAYVMYGGTAYPIGQSIANLNQAVAAYIRDIESGDDDDGDEEGDGTGTGETTSGGYLEDGRVTDDVSSPSDPIGFDGPS